jgi:alpha-beta hydrolase superfamily lysophospholipase
MGADTSEVLEATSHVESGDAQGWFSAWTALGERNLARASELRDPTSRGRALLRAHTYFLRAEFFLPADDPKRPASYARNTKAFYEGLDALGVGYEKLSVPYGEHHLNAVHYPALGSPQSTLIVFCGGSDTTVEELYFFLAAAARERGYPTLTFEGPGQGEVTREQGLHMTTEWEKPTTAVLDAYLASHPKPSKIVMVGLSLGGYLASRAAAFEPRIDGVVAYDVFYDGRAVAQRNVPAIAAAMRSAGLDGLVNSLARVRARFDTASGTSLIVGELMFGKGDPVSMVDKLSAYSLADVAPRIRQDVLLFAGEDDQFIPLDQIGQFQRALVNARSVTAKTYDRASGGAEHSQLGASTLWQADLFEWLRDRIDR